MCGLEGDQISFFRIYFFLKKIYLVLERGEGREKERERNIMCGCLSRTPTGDLACNPGMCPDGESNR